MRMCDILSSAIAFTVVAASAAGVLETQPDAGALSERVQRLEATVAYLSDRQQIHEVYVRYMRGFDRNDVELMRSAFWSDVQINYGSQSNTFDEFVTRHLQRHVTELATWGHLITNEAVDIDSDVAHVETYVTALWVPKDETSFAHGRPIFGGRYVDRLDRRNGEWRIAVREFVPHFQIKSNADAAAWDLYRKRTKSECSMGTMDNRDPSYLRPLNPRSRKDLGPPCAQ